MKITYEIIEPSKIRSLAQWLIISALIGMVIFILLGTLWVTVCHAYTDTQIADAIYKAEGGAKTRHPYGILAHYKTTTPRQACLNTIAHARKDWDGEGDFIEFLQKRYCPIGAKNDPTGLNKNWLKNVRYFLARAR
jgi:hypothetical protein